MRLSGGLRLAAAIFAVASLGACATQPKSKPGEIRINENPYPSTYQPYGSNPTLIRGATVLDGEGGRIENGSVLLIDGKVSAVGGADIAAPVRWLEERDPFALIAGPSGYGLPLVSARDVSETQMHLMSLVRPEERGRAQGVTGFSALVQALCESSLPVVFLPGVIHLPTVPVQRKINRIDLGTPDKLCGAALTTLSPPGSTA